MATFKDRGIDAAFDEGEFVHILEEGHHSDFLLEVETVKHLQEAAFTAYHSRYYNDPVTGKARQFDVRGFKQNQSWATRYYLSLECKNIRANSPLLVSTTPREDHEAFVNFVTAHNFGAHFQLRSQQTGSGIFGGHAGRSVTQFARKRDGNGAHSYTTGNDQVGEKWTQVISQLQDYASTSANEIHRSNQAAFLIPILVVSNGSIWEVGYDNDLSVEYPPHQVDFTDLFIQSSFPMTVYQHTEVFNVNHLHITTIGGLPKLLERILTLRP